MKYLLITILVILILFSPAISDNSIITPGSTVFVGEDGLDLSASGVKQGDQIGWWAPGSVRSNSPTDLLTVSSPTQFYVSPSTFEEKQGMWYTWPGGNSVFNVKIPSLKIRIYDETRDFDATGKWVPKGDTISFKIESNLYEVAGRCSDTGQIDIILLSPQGSRYSSVSGPSGFFSLEGILLTSSLTSTGPVWNTGDADKGTWVIQAEAAMNNIKNNYPFEGGGVSVPAHVLIQSVNPLIISPESYNPESGNSKNNITIDEVETVQPLLTLPNSEESDIKPVLSTNSIIKPSANITSNDIPDNNFTPEQSEEKIQPNNQTNITYQTTLSPNQTQPVIPETTRSSLEILVILSALGLVFITRRF